MKPVHLIESPPAARLARTWRWIMFWSGLALVGSFFLPVVDVFNTPVVPASMVAELAVGALTDWTGFTWGILDDLIWFPMLMAAYLFGALVAVGALAAICRYDRARRLFAGVTATMHMTTAIIVLLVSVREALRQPQFLMDMLVPDPLSITAFYGPLIALVYLLLSLRLKGRAYLCHIFIGSLAVLYWFGFWQFLMLWDRVTVYSGLHVSFAAGIWLLLAVVGEAAAVTRQGWWRTLGQLLTCRLRKPADRIGRCPQCEYFLFGLTQPRCPECGRPFTFEELGTTPEAMGFAETPDARTPAVP